ncbi:GTP cyclohydrolase II RibA [Reichenbachiella agariperforans]|uniref:GTP cyclohydrolase II RibA n=1 Tax=Reichenbachiella agariperforans TaxID=156994 RepID=UPI001C098084|nr:GTP cyclohydrolase II RibA [Reichenbachiella agariperforans]MBU2914366.1 GTP cyclohydrolase II RibA [Reichenbachiella agariperforans]
MSFEISNCQIHSHYGDFEFFCFNYGECENDNVLVLKSSKEVVIPYLRVQSACFTSEIFRSKDCDCHEQLEKSLAIISEHGGMLIYLLQDGRGAGIFDKIKGMKLSQLQGINTAEAYDKLGIERDPRSYERVTEVLEYFRITSVKLLTNNPRKIDGLKSKKITVERIPLEIEPTEDSKSYLKSKKDELGHMFSKYL